MLICMYIHMTIRTPYSHNYNIINFSSCITVYMYYIIAYKYAPFDQLKVQVQVSKVRTAQTP